MRIFVGEPMVSPAWIQSASSAGSQPSKECENGFAEVVAQKKMTGISD